MPSYFINPHPTKQAQSSDRVLFNDLAGNEDRRDSAVHVYDDMQNPLAAKMRGGFPVKKTLKEIEESFKGEETPESEVKGMATVSEDRLVGIEDVSTHATR